MLFLYYIVLVQYNKEIVLFLCIVLYIVIIYNIYIVLYFTLYKTIIMYKINKITTMYKTRDRGAWQNQREAYTQQWAITG